MRKYEKNSKEIFSIISLVITCCIIMSFIEMVIEPVYFVKSLMKMIIFLLLPFMCFKMLHIKIFDKSLSLNKKSIIKLLLLGLLIYIIIMSAYFLTKNIFDYSSLVKSLSIDQKVSPNQFVFVSLYISFFNSFLEEFLFRYVSFITLSNYVKKIVAYIFSSISFSVYHISMISSSFHPILLILSLLGLTIGGFIFNYVDDKDKKIYNSWIIHMFADFAIMTIWYIHL